MAKVVHLTTVHRPADIRIFHKEAAALAAEGYDVMLIACGEEPGDTKGVRFRALPQARSRVGRMTLTALRAFRAALVERADIYHFHDPELIPVGMLLKIAGKRVVYDVHEDAAKDIYDKPYLPGWVKPTASRAVAGVERFAINWFDGIVAATEAIAAKFPPAKTVLIRNLPMMNEMTAPTAVPFISRSERVVYIGGLAPFNGVEQMIRAMAHLPGDSGIRLTLGGPPPNEAEQRRLRSLPGAHRVDFLGWVARNAIGAIFADARAGLVVYQPTPNIMACEPNKFFELLSAGLPLVVSDLPHWRRFIEAHDCGVVVDPADPRDIARGIAELVSNPEHAESMGQRGRALVVSEYNWEAERGRLLAFYEALLKRSAATRAPRKRRTSEVS